MIMSRRALNANEIILECKIGILVTSRAPSMIPIKGIVASLITLFIKIKTPHTTSRAATIYINITGNGSPRLIK